MRWSIPIARIAGIQVKIHLTFFMLLAFMGFLFYRQGGMEAAWSGVIFISLIFLCVLLHEFGHAFAAKAFGIRTPDITLLPIGGVARLEKMPDKPMQEIIVAVAGPAVNVVIALVLYLVLLPSGGPQSFDPFVVTGPSMVERLMFTNIFLVVFNMIPAFPMDGGRVLRACLALRMNYARATNIAATVGQGFAFVMGFVGLLWNPMMILVAVFIYLGASQEASFAQMRDVSRGMHVSNAMVSRFTALPDTATLDDAIEALLSSSQPDFPITDMHGEVCGILTRNDLVIALRQRGPQTPVVQVMREGVPTVQAGMMFDQAFALMQKAECPVLPVVDATGRLVGLFTPENVGELMMVHSALGGRLSRAEHLRVAELPPPLP